MKRPSFLLLLKLVSLLCMVALITPTFALAQTSGGSGTILREYWNNVTGTTIASLTSNANYPNSPSGSQQLTALEGPTNAAENYGSRIRGYIHPPTSGAYTFWLASDDDGELWLSTNDIPANATRIAYVSGWTNAREWTKFASQQSAAINLTAGQKYYIEVLQKEGTGGDHVAVAWQGPGISQAVIAGTYLSPFVPQQGNTLSVNAGGSASGSFIADTYFSGGSTFSTTNAIDTSQISGTVPPQAVFQTERYGEFTYTIPNRIAGSAQTVTLYFTETYWTAAGQRKFDVLINGSTVLSAFDIFAAAGATNRAIARTFTTTANASGQVVVQFTRGAGPDNPKVNSISISGGGSTTNYTLTVNKAGTGSGTVSGSGIDCGATCSASYASGTSVTLTASPAGGSTFAGWSGACTGSGTCVVSMTQARTVTATFNGGSNPSTFSNPVLWEDLADVDIIRVGNTYYYSASTMHYSPGAPILRSYDLVNWEFVGHSVPSLPGSSTYNLSGGRAYVNGVWASSLAYRTSNSTFYWIGCLHNAGGGHMYTATNIQGPWTDHALSNCYYDVGLLVDTDNTMYVAYGNTQISVAQLSSDGFSQVKSQQVYSTPSSIGTLEGSRFYKINGNYYIFVTRPANGQYVLKSSSPWGPYTIKQLLLDLPGPISGGGVPHQGGLVQTQNGDWYYMAFVDAFPGGRVPVLAPITWGSDGFPVLTTVNSRWGASYPFPNLPYTPLKSPTGTDSFSGTALGPEWEWNHNPDTTKFSVNNRLTLQTATVTNDLYQARNTLTHRILGPTSTATIKLNYGTMQDGDRAGFALLRDLSAWIGVRRDSGQYRVAFVNNINMNSSWNTTSTGTEVTSAAISGGTIWLRIAADINPGTGRQGRFYYSTDGTNFTQLGTYTLGNAWQFFMGYRYAIFNYATQAVGGSITIDSFTMTKP